MKNIIPQYRKKISKRTLGVNLSMSTISNLIKMHETMSDKSQSQMVQYCIDTVFNYGLYGDQIKVIQALKKISAEFPVYLERDARRKEKEDSPQEQALTKEALVTQFGGEVSNGSCNFNKYQVTGMGEVVRFEQTMPLYAFPDSEEDIRKFMIGSFATLGEAEIKYEQNRIQTTSEPDRVIKYKK